MIKFGNENLDFGEYVVYNVSIDKRIPALLLQLWKFDGGYDHSFANVMEIDFGINKRAELLFPTKHDVVVDKILSYRGELHNMTEKEKFFFDLWPKTKSVEKNSENTIPFEVKSNQLDGITIILTSWTPMQKIPVERIKEGSVLEVWNLNSIYSVMKVKKL